MRVCAVQHDIVWCDREANYARLAPRIAEAATHGAGLVLLSEMFPTGFATDRPDLGEPADGPSSAWLARMAREHRTWVGGSYAELGEGPRPFNTFLLCGPDGQAHRYRKVHTFGYGGEDRHFDKGTGPLVVDLGGLTVALFVCYDLRFADAWWALAPQVDAYLLPANWPAARSEHWRALLQARAIENQAYVIGANRVGEGGGLAYDGDSAVIDPWGEVLATSRGEEDLLMAEVSRERVREIRTGYPFLRDR